MSKQKNKVKHNKIIILILIDILLVFFVLIPFIKKNNNIKTELEIKKLSVDDLLAQGQTISGVKNKYQKIEPEMNGLKDMFIKEDAELDLVIFLESIADDNNLLQKINIKKEENIEDKLKKLSVDLKVEGGFVNTIRYIEQIEKSDFNIDIISISMINQEETVYSNIFAEILYN